jgi:hypothetical protein
MTHIALSSGSMESVSVPTGKALATGGFTIFNESTFCPLSTSAGECVSLVYKHQKRVGT